MQILILWLSNSVIFAIWNRMMQLKAGLKYVQASKELNLYKMCK